MQKLVVFSHTVFAHIGGPKNDEYAGTQTQHTQYLGWGLTPLGWGHD